jgi:hypothetical protein
LSTLATSTAFKVTCRCGKVARILRSGRIVNEDTLRTTPAKARTLNSSGHPNLYACDDCGQDFGGEGLRKRHRVGRGAARRCMSPHEMVGRNWFADERGRWRQPGPKSPERMAGLTVAEAVEALLRPSEPKNAAGDVREPEAPKRARLTS